MSGFFGNERYTMEMRDKYLVKYYDMIAYRGRYAFFDGKDRCAREVQKTHHFDTLVNVSENKAVGFEEKIRTRRYNDFLIETQQSTITGAPGWIYTSAADKLLYAYPTADKMGLEFYLLDMELVQLWFEGSKHKYTTTIGEGERNKPEFCIIPKKVLLKCIIAEHWIVDDNGCREIEIVL